MAETRTHVCPYGDPSCGQEQPLPHPGRFIKTYRPVCLPCFADDFAETHRRLGEECLRASGQEIDAKMAARIRALAESARQQLLAGVRPMDLDLRLPADG